MAKDKEAATKKEKKEKAEAPEFKYGVSDLAEKLEIQPASVRIRLRNAEIKKNGRSYGWNSEKELKEVVSQLTSKAA